MPIPNPSIVSASHMFMARIADPARRGRAVDLSLGGSPGLTNQNWINGAYLTTLPQGAKGYVIALTPEGKSGLVERAGTWPLAFNGQAAFDSWLGAEISHIDNIVAEHSPDTDWTLGRSQKFINIVLKYVCAAFHSNMPAFADFVAANPGVEALTELLHAPIDRATIIHAIGLECAHEDWGTTTQPLSWWRDMNSDQYDAIQAALRAAAAARGMRPIHYEMVFVW